MSNQRALTAEEISKYMEARGLELSEEELCKVNAGAIWNGRNYCTKVDNETFLMYFNQSNTCPHYVYRFNKKQPDINRSCVECGNANLPE